jgi:hydroxyethylthiazole kinase-like uncharacterized protein yjeF
MPTSTALYTVNEIRDIEQAAQAALPQGTLMQRAGQAAAKAALTLIPNPRGDAKVLVLVGPGNNGGDALEVASRLAQAGVQVTVLMYADPDKQSFDSQQAYARAQNSSAHFADPAFLSDIAATRWTFVVDGLYGIGLDRAITGNQRSAIEYINTLTCPILALDVPSGLNADTGNIVGEHGVAVRASHTITFLADKPGLHTGYGRDHAGAVQLAKLDIETRFFMPAHAQLNDVKLFASALRRRQHNSHKGSYGDVVVIGGAQGMSGAPILSARAAVHCGAGRVFAVFVGPAPAYDSAQPELMCRSAHDFEFSSKTLVIGPGLGTSRDAHDVLAQALNSTMPLVIDADALNLIAIEPGLQTKLIQRCAPALMTPHPLEAARLLGTSNTDVQADRLTAARRLAQQCNATVILKGSGTVIARPDGNVVINTNGNPALATAGTGDVLAGICGALLAQHWPIWEAAMAAVWLHGQAADRLVEHGIGPIGLTASELIPAVRSALNRITMDYASLHVR